MSPATAETTELITAQCQQAICEEIDSAGGSEVFFVGRLDSEMLVEEVEAYAFGNKRGVPALLQYARPGDVILHNHPSGLLEPSQPDIEISSLCGERGIGSYIINNDCSEVRIVVKAMRPETSAPLDEDALARVLEPEGRISASLETYEYRESQVQMLRSVTEAFNREGVVAIEAPTGTGKSMAYLLPAIAWSLKNKEKVVVSTETINLQEQLLDKDIPLLVNALNLDITAVLIKGRNNYLCRRKADYIGGHPDFLDDGEKREQLDAILQWTRTTREGSKSDLGFVPEYDVWEKVMSEADNCLRTKCPFYESCFYYNAKRRAARANILIVNHHLLMSDLAVRADTANYTDLAVLPPFDRLILDEAHHLEEVATEYFGAKVSRQGLITLCNRLSAPKTGEGMFRYLASKIHDQTYPLFPDRATEWQLRLGREALASHRELLDAIDEATDRTAIVLDQLDRGAVDQRVDVRMRITTAISESNSWQTEIHEPLTRVLRAGRNMMELLVELRADLMESVDEETTEVMTPLLELRSLTRRIEGTLNRLLRFLEEGEDQCRWIEYRRRPNQRWPVLSFCIAPVEIADDIRENLLRRFRTVLMTSATLTVEQKFDYFRRQIGATDTATLGYLHAGSDGGDVEISGNGQRHFRTMMLDSPFDFDRQAYAGVPVDLPEPKNPGFPGALAEFLAKSLQVSRGRAFVLFTSYHLMNRVYDDVAPRLEEEGITCLRQGSASRSFLAETFRSDVGSVLFATSSFWEGVDVPGESLSCVFLTRLPFGVPTEPMMEARAEAMRSRGIDPFMNLVVPRAVIRFRQGFGRLIRRRQDRGAVIICDRRVASATYGKMFLRSLPIANVEKAPTEQILEGLGRILNAEVREDRAADFSGKPAPE